jgi:hypothetical protein
MEWKSDATVQTQTVLCFYNIIQRAVLCCFKTIVSEYVLSHPHINIEVASPHSEQLQLFYNLATKYTIKTVTKRMCSLLSRATAVAFPKQHHPVLFPM